MSGVEKPRPEHEWHEDIGAVLWWLWPIEQPPYVGTPLDLGYTIEVGLDIAASDGTTDMASKRFHVGGWPFGDEQDERRCRLWWTPLPDCDEIDRAIRDDIRGGPDPFLETEEAQP